MRRLSLPLIIAVTIAGALALPGSASAAACPADLKVVGLALTGADCIDLGAGQFEIDTPRLLSAQTVELRGKFNLNVARTQLKQKTTVVPIVAAIKDSGGAYRPFMAGTLEVGNFEVCGLFGSFAFPSTGGNAELKISEASTVTTNDRLSIHVSNVACVSQPAIKVTQPALKLVTKLLNLDLSVDPSFQVNDSGVSVALPTNFGLDEARGGRVFGNLTAQVPLTAGKQGKFGLTVEVSRNEGLKPVSLAAAYDGVIPLFPGVTISSPAIVIDPVNKRYGGRLRIGLPLKLATAGAEILVENGSLKRIGFDIGLPPPGFPLPPPAPPVFPLISIQSFGATLVRGGTFPTPTGQTITSPASFQGRMSFTAGPIVPLPGGSFKALVADLDLTITGPTVQLRGTLSAINNLIKLATARVLVGASPFRMEAQATVAFPNSAVAVITGDIFAGVTANAFTGLGTLTMQIPNPIPVIGGQQLGGFSGVVSNLAIGGVITVDPPIVKPRTIGVVFKYGGGFDIVDSITPFITVTPQPIGLRVGPTGFASQAPSASTFTLTDRKGDLAVQVEGATGSKPSGISITGPDGKTVKTSQLGSTATTVVLSLTNPAPGAYKVNGSGITKVVVATLDDPSYLDPRPGFGTRPKPPINPGTTVPVCWDIKHAPAGAVVDLFEDTNGFAATGRDIATGLPAAGCYDIPTTDWEPGRHWAYGVVRVGDTPLNIRYWPIGITIVDPKRLAAPASLKAKRTTDGATATWKAVAGASGYQVNAVPVDPQDAPAQQVLALADAKPSAKLSLRGARRWTVSVQAVDLDGALGNISRVIKTGAKVPVVLAGRPNGTPQVGKPWAFELDTENLSSLKVLAAPKGTRLNRAKGLLTWTPSAAAGKADPQVLRVKGCARDKRCVTQEWKVNAYGAGLAPAGPARGFKVLDSVVKAGETIELRSQGVDEAVTVRIDGRKVKASVSDEQTIVVRLPKRLAKGAHDVSLRIGGDLEEELSGAIVVL